MRVPTNQTSRRRYLADQIHDTGDEKWQAILARVTAVHAEGRPLLVGTRSVGDSERLSRMLEDVGLAHEVLNARQDEREADIVAAAGERGRITVATNMAGRGTDIRLGPGVRELGGLNVIATERHEAGRIDRQLFGRCARQGDPGSCEAIVSLEDEVVRSGLGPVLRRVTALLTMLPPALRRRVGATLVDRAQRASERRNARVRADLLTYDEQLDATLAFSGYRE